MRFSDALGLLSQQWKVPLSELTSYHRALRAADAIPAYSAGRGKQDVSEDAIIRFVLAYCTSRSPSICAERLPLALGMRRSNQMERHFPEVI